MEVEAKLQQYLLLAKHARGAAAADLVTKATSEPALFAFGELLDTPSIKDLQSGHFASYYALLQLFAYGTCGDYKVQAALLPTLTEAQTLKLKQLTVVSLAASNKVIHYAMLQLQLDIATVRELEDFIIKECFYTGIIKGKLDQKQHLLQVHSAIGRDVNAESLADLAAGLASWTSTSDNLLRAIEARITYAQETMEAAKKHREEVETRQEDMRKALKAEMDIRGGGSGAEAMLLDEFADVMDEDRLERLTTERIDRHAMRPKSRRR